MKLTKSQRLDAYTYMYLDLLADDIYEDDLFICLKAKEWLVENVSVRYAFHKGYFKIVRLFPELLEQKPEGVSEAAGWWHPVDKVSRIKAIQKAIILTENAIE